MPSRPGSPVTNASKSSLTDENLKSIPKSRFHSIYQFLSTASSLDPYHTAAMHNRAKHSEEISQQVKAIDDIKNKS